MMIQFDILPLIDIGGVLDINVYLEVKEVKIELFALCHLEWSSVTENAFGYISSKWN